MWDTICSHPNYICEFRDLKKNSMHTNKTITKDNKGINANTRK